VLHVACQDQDVLHVACIVACAAVGTQQHQVSVLVASRSRMFLSVQVALMLFSLLLPHHLVSLTRSPSLALLDFKGFGFNPKPYTLNLQTF